jgi:hypothetical protein
MGFNQFKGIIMTKRFANLSNRGPAVESPNWGDPGDYRNRNKGDALVPSQDPKYAKRLPEFRPQVPASSAKVSASTAPAPAASTAPKTPAKSAKAIAMDAVNARINAVFDSPASAGKKKAAGRLLHMTKASASEIIAQLKALEPDAVREAKENQAMWKRATAKANKVAGFADTPTEPENAVQAAWAKAVERANALNGFGGAA